MSRSFPICTALIAIALCAFTAVVSAQQKVTVTVDPKASGIAIPDDFMGLSFESAAILPDASGHYPYFRPDNLSLIQLFKTLGIKNLRIGGNTADRPSVKVPSPPDIDAVYAFARDAGTNVTYTLRLRESNPKDVVAIAKYVMDRYQQQTRCLTIGNEPNIYEKEYPKYRDDLTAFMSAITAVAPDAKFCGPATTPEAGDWAASFAADFGHAKNVVEVTQHSYPGGNGKKVDDPVAGREKMLSPSFSSEYEKLYTNFVLAVRENGLKYRVEETNNFYNGGAKDVSNTFASALWGLDYLYWWASRDSDGLNFHTGDNVAAGEQQTPCWYATFWTVANGYEAHPLAYAIKAFTLGSHGRLLPVHISNGASNFSAYAVLGADDSLYITLINKSEAPSSGMDIILNFQEVRAKAAAMYLTAPQSDIAAKDGITLGGSSISLDGAWQGKWQTLNGGKNIVVKLGPSSAVVVKLAH